jgi:hypothetical protein
VPGYSGDESIIGGLLDTVIWEYIELSRRRENLQNSLMYIGMLLHTFADTYAHQLFSGYNSWVNDVKLTQVTDNITNQDVTAQMRDEITWLTTGENKNNDESIIPAIGHAQAGHTPDLTNISFTMKYKSAKDSGYDLTYSRSNTETFTEACRHIFNYLGKCFNKPDVSDSEWGPIKKCLTRAFLVRMPGKKVEETLAEHWKRIFPEVSYYYNKQTIEDRFSANTKTSSETNGAAAYTEDFYRYNCMADKVLIDLYGSSPRK